MQDRLLEESGKKETLTNTNNQEQTKSKRVVLIVPAVLLIIIVFGFGLTQTVLKGSSLTSGVTGASSFIKNLKPQTAYWAVFLSNGQTYFGKLDPDDLNGNYILLSEVYYLEKNTTDTTTTSVKTPTATSTPGYNLIHLGNELHGPTDQMIINRANVLFIEQLKSDSGVVAAIASSKR